MSILTKLSQLSSNLSPATQKKIVVTNNYDMPILTEFLQLNPSQSPELKSIMKTSNSTNKSLQSPHKFVKMMKVNSPTTTISIPNTTDDENTIDEEKIISKNRLLTDSIESNLSLFTDVWSEKNTQALRANLKKTFGEDLLMNWSKGGGDGSVVVIPPLKHLLLDDVPDPPERQQPRQLPHYHRQRQIIVIPLHSCDETIIQYY